jgi:hypothetical protein
VEANDRNGMRVPLRDGLGDQASTPRTTELPRHGLTPEIVA